MKDKLSLVAIKEMFAASVFVLKHAWVNHRRVFFWTFGTAILLAVSPYLQRGAEALLINYLTNNTGGRILSNELLLLILLVPIALLFNNIVSASNRYWDISAWKEMRTKFEIMFTEKMASLDIATHEDPKFRDKAQLLEEMGSSYLISNFYEKIVDNMTNIVGFLTAAIIMSRADWRILLLVILVSIPRFLVELRFGADNWSIHQTHSQDKRHLWHAQRQVSDAEHIRELHTYQTTDFFVNRIKNILDKFHLAQQKKDKQALIWRIISQSLVSISFGLIVFILIRPVLMGTMQIGTFVFILAAAMGLQQAVIGFFLSVSNQYKDAKTVNTFVEMMGEKRKIVSGNGNIKLALEKAPEIIFENVSFAYPSKPNELVLHNFNLKISPGEKLAIVGLNGAGKSTFIKLLCRFYDPTEGRILINGQDLKNLNLDDWYKYVALLAQDYQTYRLQVKDLIHLGKINTLENTDKIKKASLQADADEFVSKWKFAYDQQIGVEFTEGVDPSQGQKQKLSLARALYRDAFVTILDEPTASVDAKAEKQIFDQLEKVMDDSKTLILISHRFATVRNADKIAVIDGQNIKEYGTHAQLIKKNGIYKQMYSTQAEGYRD